MNNYFFDIVVLLGPNDREQIITNINYNSKNIIGYRNYYVVTYDYNIKLPENVIKIDEKIFPFTMDDVVYYHGKLDRNGWYLQQLIKFYASNIIPNILDTYLVIDADTFFLKPTSFIENNKFLYNTGNEYHFPYFEHMKKLHPSLEKIYPDKSGICHHMIYQKKYVNELIELVENYHNSNNILNEEIEKYKNDNELFKFWKLFLIYSYKHRTFAGGSEYEIYFNYMCKYHRNDIEIRNLNWKNVDSLSGIENWNYNYISYHWWNH